MNALWPHFCNNGPASISTQFDRITHLISALILVSANTLLETRAGSTSSGSLRRSLSFFSYLCTCFSLDSSPLRFVPTTSSHVSPPQSSGSAPSHILLSLYYRSSFTTLLHTPDSVLWFSAQMIPLSYFPVLYHGAKQWYGRWGTDGEGMVKSFPDRYQNKSLTEA
ncbi:hypothetical protein EDB83DRAFT_2418491 [Lactarius deliciosus]|nr:hypothetical protein EDB83DRAFT_2418491 [Lactarius deliciosus]